MKRGGLRFSRARAVTWRPCAVDSDGRFAGTLLVGAWEVLGLSFVGRVVVVVMGGFACFAVGALLDFDGFAPRVGSGGGGKGMRP